MTINEMFNENRLTLIKANYKSIPKDPDIGVNQIAVKDTFKSKISSDGERLLVQFSRNVDFIPIQIFSIEVEYSIIWQIEKKHFNEVKNKVDAWSQEEMEWLCYTAPSESALLISVLTKANNLPPLWTPDELVFDEESNKETK